MEHWCSIVFVFVGPLLVWQKLIFDDIWSEGVGLIGAQPWLWWVEYMLSLVFVFLFRWSLVIAPGQEQRKLALRKFSPSLSACACTTQFWEHLLRTEEIFFCAFQNCQLFFMVCNLTQRRAKQACCAEFLTQPGHFGQQLYCSVLREQSPTTEENLFECFSSSQVCVNKTHRTTDTKNGI